MSYASQASAQLSRMPEAPGAEYCCFTRSRTSPNTVAWTSFVVRDAPKLNQAAGPLPFAEVRLAFKGEAGRWGEGGYDECEGDGVTVSGVCGFSSRGYVLDLDVEASVS
jgi:hypothetical protein